MQSFNDKSYMKVFAELPNYWN